MGKDEQENTCSRAARCLGSACIRFMFFPLVNLYLGEEGGAGRGRAKLPTAGFGV